MTLLVYGQEGCVYIIMRFTYMWLWGEGRFTQYPLLLYYMSLLSPSPSPSPSLSSWYTYYEYEDASGVSVVYSMYMLVVIVVVVCLLLSGFPLYVGIDSSPETHHHMQL